MRVRSIAFGVLCLSLVGCDHATKAWAEHALRKAPPLHVWRGLLDLRYAQNDDVAFNLLSFIPSDTRYFVIVAFTLLASGALWWLWRQQPTSGIRQLAMALMLAGAVGNFIDRIARGYVVDFIHLSHWPVFNVADMAIVMGMVMWLWPHRENVTPALSG